MTVHHFRAPGARRIVSASLVIGVAFVVFGMSFGVLAVGAGASVVQACVMSLFIFTGASQMSVVSVIAAGGSPASAFGGAVLRMDGAHASLAAGRADDDAVAEEHGFRDVVGDEDYCAAVALPEGLEVECKLVAGDGVERGKRLVHQQQGRVVQQRAADADARAHAA